MTNSTAFPSSDALEACFQLARAQATIARRFDGHLGGFHGLSFADLNMLVQLGRAEGARLRRVDLAEKLGLTASAVTRALIPLERIGIVTRQPDPHDARVGYATLTKAGARVVTEALDSAELISERIVGEVSATELRALRKTLSGIAG